MPTEQQALEANMLADHNDRTARRVYADWLEENGHTKAADRLRWLADAHEHPVSEGDGPLYLRTLDYMPQWVTQVNSLHQARTSLEANREGLGDHYQPLKHALHQAELHHLSDGALTGDALPTIEATTQAIRHDGHVEALPPRAQHAVYAAHAAVHNWTHSASHHANLALGLPGDEVGTPRHNPLNIAAYHHMRINPVKLAKKKRKAEPALPVGAGLRKDHLGATLEKAAVAHAVRKHYGVDLPRGDLTRFVQATGGFAHGLADRAPGAKQWVDHITGWKGKHITRSDVETAADKLRQSGLLGVAGKFLTEKKGHAPLPQPIVTAAPRRSGFVELPQGEQTHQPSLVELGHSLGQVFPGTPKPATDETVKPASMRPGDVKARRVEAQAGQSEFTDPSAPLPLAEVPDEMPGVRHRDRHTMIAQHVLAQKKPHEIVAALQQHFQLTPRVARDTFRRWHDLARTGMTKAATDHVEKLARKGQTDPEAKTQVADLTHSVDPMIAGTRLAAHLIKIIKDTAGVQDDAGEQAHLWAKYALAGKRPKGLNAADPFAELGHHLRKIGHPLYGKYNWGDLRSESGRQSPGIGKSLDEMRMMNEFLGENFKRPEGMDDREFLRRALHNYSIEAGEKKLTPAHAAFWQRLEAKWNSDKWQHLRGLRGPKDSPQKMGWATAKNRMNDAMYRLYTMADDRHTFENVDTSKRTHFENTQKPVRGVAQPPQKEDWRSHFQKAWNTTGDSGSKHMKFSRLPASPDAGDLVTMNWVLKLAAAKS